MSSNQTSYTDACITWTGAKTAAGYGERNIGGRILYVHRLAYEAAYGPIPAGLTIDHLCKNRACINPDHLEAVTMRENVLRGRASEPQALFCAAGHRLTAATIKPRRGRRAICRECSRVYAREWYAARKAKDAQQ